MTNYSTVQEYQTNQIKRTLNVTSIIGVISTVICIIFWISFVILSLPRLDATLLLTIPILVLPPLIIWVILPISIINMIITRYQIYKISKLRPEHQEYKTAIPSLIFNFIPVLCVLAIDIVIGLNNLNTFYTSIS